MECYNCGAALTLDSYCRQCGADIRVYGKILRASNSFYNEGLDRANVRNLSGAIESLKKSLQLNKMNIDARNLLGLVYFEMGDTVSALSEWVISKHFMNRGNAAVQYLNEIQNNPSRLDAINQTIKKYNQALIYCRQDSRDLAIIQLKKVLSLNPKLVKGHQLLALLYIEEGKYDQANKALRIASKIDENNTTTLRYQKEIKNKLKESSSRKSKKEDLISYQSGNDTVIMPAQFKDNSAWQTILNIVIGVALGIGIAMFLLLPNMQQQSKSEENEAIKAANDTIFSKDQSISSLEGQVEDLTNQVKEAKEAAQAVESRFASYEALIGAYSAYTTDDMDAAGEALGRAKSEDFSEGVAAAYNDISAKINEKYLATLYQEGYNAYSKGDYQTAAEKLLKVAETDEAYQDGNAIYYLAQAYRRQNNMEAALVYYQKVLDKYPGTQRARTAQSYINANGQAETGQQPSRQGEQQPDGQPGQQQEEQEEGQEGQQQDGQPGTVAGARGIYKDVKSIGQWILTSFLLKTNQKGRTSMECKYQLKDGCMRISMPREVDHHCAEQLRREADLLIGAYHIRRLVFDFKATEFMDSSGIGVVIGRCKNMGYSGGEVSAEHLNERLQKFFVVSGLHKMVRVTAGQPTGNNGGEQE